MRGNLPRRCSVGVQQASCVPVRPVPLVALHRPLERLPDNRMQEPQRPVRRDHLEPRQSLGQPLRLGDRERGDRGRVTQLAAVAEDRQRLRERQRGRIEPHHPRHEPRRDVLPPDREQRRQVQLLEWATVLLDRAQDLLEIERVPAAGLVQRGTQLVADVLRQSASRDVCHRRRAEQRGPDDLGLAAHREQRGAARRPLERAERQDQAQRQPSDPRCEVGEPAQRRLIRPVSVVDGHQHRSSGREVRGRPVEGMHDGERRVGRSRAGEQVSAASRERALEQLSDDPEREVGLHLRPPGVQHLLSRRAGPPTRRLEQRRLADPRPALDRHHPAAPIQQLACDGEFPLPLDQDIHTVTLEPPTGSARARYESQTGPNAGIPRRSRPYTTSHVMRLLETQITASAPDSWKAA